MPVDGFSFSLVHLVASSLGLRKHALMNVSGGHHHSFRLPRWVHPSNNPFLETWVTTISVRFFADGHTVSNAPDLFRPPKLSNTGPGQYRGGGPPGKSSGCCQLCMRRPFPLALSVFDAILPALWKHASMKGLGRFLCLDRFSNCSHGVTHF